MLRRPRFDLILRLDRCRVSLIYHSYGTPSSVGGISHTLRLRVDREFDDDLHPVRRSAPTEAHEAAFARFRICDRIALLSHPRLVESGVRGQKLLVTFAVEHVLARIPEPDTSPGLTIGGCFTTTVRRAAGAGAVATVAIVVRQAAAKTKVVAICTIIATALLRYGYRSVAMSAALGMSLESRDNTGCPNLSGLPWQLASPGDPPYQHIPHLQAPSARPRVHRSNVCVRLIDTGCERCRMTRGVYVYTD